MDDAMRDAVVRRRPRAALRALADEQGMMPLRGDAWTKVQAGVTTIEEVLRVVQG